MGYGKQAFFLWILPSECAIIILSCLFDYLPHRPHVGKKKTDGIYKLTNMTNSLFENGIKDPSKILSILTFNQLNTNFYSYIHTFYKYKYCKIFLHNLNYKRDTVCFHINIYFNDGSQKKSLILENYLNLQQIIKHMNNYYKQCRTVDSTKKVINDLKLFNFNKIINILLQQKNIYKQ